MSTCVCCGRSGFFLLTDRDRFCHGCGEISAAGDPRKVQDDVRNAKLRRGRTVLGDFFVMHVRHDGWMASFAAKPLEVLRWQDALWLHAKCSTIDYHGVPVSTRRVAVLHFGSSVLEVEARGEADAEFVLTFASTRAPWATVGYTSATDGEVRTRLHEFRASVDARRRSFLERQDGEEWRPPWPVPGLELDHPGWT